MFGLQILNFIEVSSLSVGGASDRVNSIPRFRTLEFSRSAPPPVGGAVCRLDYAKRALGGKWSGHSLLQHLRSRRKIAGLLLAALPLGAPFALPEAIP